MGNKGCSDLEIIKHFFQLSVQLTNALRLRRSMCFGHRTTFYSAMQDTVGNRGKSSRLWSAVTVDEVPPETDCLKKCEDTVVQWLYPRQRSQMNLTLNKKKASSWAEHCFKTYVFKYVKEKYFYCLCLPSAHTHWLCKQIL